ncbi:hypothetical protein [Trinickia mobilis]|uniref:hypothetical protein n=1 Tax=Trinickia mobilis TaxID=2816356 RepID=UPI001A8C5A6C|nr:hypothetical protein [Trinickia mobilis]
MSTPRDIPHAMLYLESEAAYLSGQTIIVAGGDATTESSAQLTAPYEEQAFSH